MMLGRVTKTVGIAINGALFLGYVHPVAVGVALTALFLTLLWLLALPSVEPHRRFIELVNARPPAAQPTPNGLVCGECVRCQNGGGRAGPPR